MAIILVKSGVNGRFVELTIDSLRRVLSEQKSLLELHGFHFRWKMMDVLLIQQPIGSPELFYYYDIWRALK